jgi:hypothetical protein
MNIACISYNREVTPHFAFCNNCSPPVPPNLQVYLSLPPEICAVMAAPFAHPFPAGTWSNCCVNDSVTSALVSCTLALVGMVYFSRRDV